MIYIYDMIYIYMILPKFDPSQAVSSFVRRPWPVALRAGSLRPLSQ